MPIFVRSFVSNLSRALKLHLLGSNRSVSSSSLKVLFAYFILSEVKLLFVNFVFFQERRGGDHRRLRPEVLEAGEQEEG